MGPNIGALALNLYCILENNTSEILNRPVGCSSFRGAPSHPRSADLQLRCRRQSRLDPFVFKQHDTACFDEDAFDGHREIHRAALILVSRDRNCFRRLAGDLVAMFASSKGNLIVGFDHPRSASSTAVSSKWPQNANRIRLSGRRLANLTPAPDLAPPTAAIRRTSSAVAL